MYLYSSISFIVEELKAALESNSFRDAIFLTRSVNIVSRSRLFALDLLDNAEGLNTRGKPLFDFFIINGGIEGCDENGFRKFSDFVLQNSTWETPDIKII